MGRRAFGALVGLLGLAIVGYLVFQSGLWVGLLGSGEYEEGSVTVTNGSETPTPCDTSPNATEVTACDGKEQLATVQVRIANTFQARYTGLSETDSLGPDEGMLFVHNEEAEYTYVMRDMAFPLDIIFVAENGTITTIHHAPLPPEGTSESELQGYSGRGKYVLEVNRGWANRTGVSVGDTVELPDSVE
jgi:uncharacterized membrane protein (UPF0127 family)